MQGTILGELLLKVASSFLIEVGKHGIRTLLKEPPLSRAITATSDAFPQIEGIHQALSKWCESKKFTNILEKLNLGEREITGDDVTSSFINTSNFYAGEETETKFRTQQILEFFVKKLEYELYADRSGLTMLANRQEVLHHETRDKISNIIHQTEKSIIDSISNLPSQLQQVLLLSHDDVDKSLKVQEKVLHAKVDEAQSLLQEGKVKSAQTILYRLRNEPTIQNSSAELKFRIATDLGACALELGDIDMAKKEIQTALEYQPENYKALSNAALSAILDKKPEEALRLSIKARHLNEKDPHTTSIYIQALYQLGRIGEIEQLLLNEPWIAEDPKCTFFLGQIKCDVGKYEEAESILRVSLRKDSKNSQAHMLLAQAIIAPIQRVIQEDPPLRWRIDEETMDRTKEAENALTQAFELLEHHENRAHLHLALANRAGIRGMLGYFEEALKDCDRVLIENETHEVALRNKGLILLQNGKASEAVACFEKVQRQDDQDAITISLAQAYYDSGQTDKALEILTLLWKSNQGKRRRIQIADLLLMVNTDLGNTSAIEEILQTLTVMWPHDSDVLSVVAYQRRREDKLDETTELLREALAYSKHHQRDRITLDLANLYFFQGKYAEAVKIYNTIVDKGTDNTILRRYLVSLYNLGLYQEALTIAQKIRGSGDPIPLISEIEAQVLENIGDLKHARELRFQLSRVEPKNITHHIQITLHDLRMGNREAAREVLSRIRFEEMKDDPQALIQVAQARASLGMGNVLPLAYRARRLDFGNPDMHIVYFWIFLSHEKLDNSLFEANQVSINCAVHLKRDGETKVFTILDEDSINRERGELAPTDSLAMKLMGLRKGDCIVLKEGPLEELSYEVADIQSKYVYAFQETGSEFTTWFPDHPGFHKVEIKDNDFTKVFAEVDRRHKMISQVMRLYQEKRLTLGAFARFIGIPLVEVWGRMVGGVEGQVIAASGSTNDTIREAVLLHDAGKVVLDLTALLTIGCLGLMERLPKRFDQMFVAQSVLDELNEAIERTRPVGIAQMIIGKEDDHYIREDVTLESLERRRNFLEKISNFIESSMKVMPTTIALEIEKEKFEEFERLLGEGSIASILVAKEREALLYSDDLGLRMIARNDWQAEGVWTQTVLKSMQERGILTDDEYHDAIRKLALANYHFVSFDAEDLMWILTQNGMRVTNEVMHVFELLEGPDCSEESAIRVIANLIFKVWLRSRFIIRKCGFSTWH